MVRSGPKLLSKLCSQPHSYQQQRGTGPILSPMPMLPTQVYDAQCTPKRVVEDFSRVTYKLVSKYLPDSSATDKGHLIRTRKGVRSTRSMRQAVVDARENVDDMDPTEQVCPALEDQMFCNAMLADQNKNIINSNLPGLFPVQSYAGNNYIFVAYVYKINTILMRLMKSRSDESMVKAFTDIYAYLKPKNLQPKLHVLDNECSKAVQTFIKSNGTDIQIVKPHNHSVNAAEPAVKAIKYHVIAGLTTVDINCLLQLWDLFLSQMQDTFNLLRVSRRDPSKSAYEEIEGEFVFN